MTDSIEMVREEALRFGRHVSTGRAKDILWEHTGWPSFWMRDDPERYFRLQIEEYFRAAIDGDAVDPRVPWQALQRLP